MHAKEPFYCMLTLKVSFMTMVVFAASVDQDIAAQNMQPDLSSSLSTLLQH